MQPTLRRRKSVAYARLIIHKNKLLSIIYIYTHQ